MELERECKDVYRCISTGSTWSRQYIHHHRVNLRYGGGSGSTSGGGGRYRVIINRLYLVETIHQSSAAAPVAVVAVVGDTA